MKPTTPIAQEIRRVRTALGMTLFEFGDLCGIPWQSIYRYERDGSPPADRLFAIMHATRRHFRVDRVARAVAQVARAA